MYDVIVGLYDSDKSLYAPILQVIFAKINMDNLTVHSKYARYFLCCRLTQGEPLQDQLSIYTLRVTVVFEALGSARAPTDGEFEQKFLKTIWRALVRVDLPVQAHVLITSIEDSHHLHQ